MKIAIVGIYPQPYGGLSVHIERLSKLCDCVVLDESYLYNKINGSKQIKPCYVKPSIFMTKYITEISFKKLYIYHLFTIIKRCDIIHIL